jgi:hypothetical protein
LNKRLSLEEYGDIINEVLESGGEFRIYPRGTSMLPLLREGRDSVVLRKRDPKKGDVILYKRADGSFVLHRIVGLCGGDFVLCGDNQLALERNVPRESVIAVCESFYRDDRQVSRHSLRYRIYTALWRSFTVRRVYFKIRKLTEAWRYGR